MMGSTLNLLKVLAMLRSSRSVGEGEEGNVCNQVS